MADHIRVDIAAFEQITQLLAQMGGELNSCASSLRGIHPAKSAGGQLNMKLNTSFEHIDDRMGSGTVADLIRKLAQASVHMSDATQRLSRACNAASELCSEAEKANTNMFANGVSQQEQSAHSPSGGPSTSLFADTPLYISSLRNYPSDTSLWTEEMWLTATQTLNDQLRESGSDIIVQLGPEGFTLTLGSMMIAHETTSGFLKDSTTDILQIGNTKLEVNRDHEVEFKFSSEDKPHEFDDIFSKESDTKNPLDDTNALLTRKHEVSGSISLVSEQASIQNGALTIEAGYDFSKLEGKAGFEYGLYSRTVDKNGNEVISVSPGAQLYAGASYTLMQSEIGSTYEIIDGVSTSTKVTSSIMSAGLEGAVKAGIVDGKPCVYAGAEAEAILAEVGVTKSLDVGGVKVSGTAKVNVGAGAHANVGLDGWKLTYDMGASVGVGVSFAGEVDLSGVVAKADAIATKVTQTTKSAAQFIGSTAKKVASFGKVLRGASRSLLFF